MCRKIKNWLCICIKQAVNSGTTATHRRINSTSLVQFFFELLYFTMFSKNRLKVVIEGQHDQHLGWIMDFMELKS